MAAWGWEDLIYSSFTEWDNVTLADIIYGVKGSYTVM